MRGLAPNEGGFGRWEGYLQPRGSGHGSRRWELMPSRDEAASGILVGHTFRVNSACCRDLIGKRPNAAEVELGEVLIHLQAGCWSSRFEYRTLNRPSASKAITTWMRPCTTCRVPKSGRCLRYRLTTFRDGRLLRRHAWLCALRLVLNSPALLIRGRARSAQRR